MDVDGNRGQTAVWQHAIVIRMLREDEIPH